MVFPVCYSCIVFLYLVFHAAEETPVMAQVPPVFVALSNKGGVSKTTDTSLMAEYACIIRRKRCAIIDFDGQLNATAQWVGCEYVNGYREPPEHPDITDEDLGEFNKRSAITDLYRGKSVLPYPTKLGPEDPDDITAPRVDIIPCSASGMQWVQETISPEENENANPIKTLGRQMVSGVPTADVVRGLYDFCRQPELRDYYDLVLVDSGPGVNTLFAAALNAATHVLVPYIPENYSLMGIGPLLFNYNQANRNRPLGADKIKFLGLLPSKVDTRNNVHNDMVAETLRNPSTSKAHVPEGYFVPSSVHITRRSTLNRPSMPYSIFDMKPSEPIRQKCEMVFGYLFDKIFEGEAQA